MLRVQGARIVDADGKSVQLRGVGLGGWMNMENFITGYPGNEESWRDALRRELGEDRYEYFFERFLETFFGEEDAAFLASLGLNLVRIAVNYRHLESDAEPFTVVEEGFRHLDRVVEICARHGIYTIIDLHAVQGYQNADWHSDNPTHRAFLWKHRGFQDRAVHLWEAIAARYRGQEWVAGYNLINEPYDPEGVNLLALSRRIYDAVTAIDREHIIFLDGNHYGSDLSVYTEPWPNTVYSAHEYALPGWIDGGPYPGYTGSVWCDPAFLEKHYLKKSTFTREHNVPFWVGEFGPVYTDDPEKDAMRYAIARDQIELFDRYGAHWAIWTYKDIGLQGVVYTAPDSPWMRRLRPALERKTRLGTDSWGGRDIGVRDVIEPIEWLFTREYPSGDPIPNGKKFLTDRLVRHVLLAEALLPEFAAAFRGVTNEEIDELMASFAFENCVKREGLVKVLQGEKVAQGEPAG